MIRRLPFDRRAQGVRSDHPGAATKAQNPSDEFAAVGDGDGHPQLAARQPLELLARMPDSVFDPGRRGLVELEFHLNTRSSHDGE